MAEADGAQTARLGVGAVLGGWHLEAVLGQGGMGVVFRAVHETSGLQAALKVLHVRGGASVSSLRRFQREAKILARLRHPSVVTILQAELEHSPPYFCMELLPGGTLTRRITAAGQAHGRGLAAGELLAIALDLADGLAAVHAENMLHRDIKPANVLFAADGRPKLADFGLAKALDMTSVTHEQSVMGSMPYLAPESLQRREPDARTDLYQLGVTLMEAALAAPPFAPEQLFAFAAGRPFPALPGVGQARPDLPAFWGPVFERLLAVDPAERFQSAAELLDLLKAEQGEYSVLAPGPAERPASATPSKRVPAAEPAPRVSSRPQAARAHPSGQANPRPATGPAPGPATGTRPAGPGWSLALALATIAFGAGWWVGAGSGSRAVPAPAVLAQPPSSLAVPAAPAAPTAPAARAAPTAPAAVATGATTPTTRPDDAAGLVTLLAAETSLSCAVVPVTKRSAPAAAPTTWHATVFVVDSGSLESAQLKLRGVGAVAASWSARPHLALESVTDSLRVADVPLARPVRGPDGTWGLTLAAGVLHEGYNRFRIEPGQALPPGALAVRLELARRPSFARPPPVFFEYRDGNACPSDLENALDRATALCAGGAGYSALELLRAVATRHPRCRAVAMRYADIVFEVNLFRKQFDEIRDSDFVGTFWEGEFAGVSEWDVRSRAHDLFNRMNRVLPRWKDLWRRFARWSRESGDYEAGTRMNRWLLLATPAEAELWCDLADCEQNLLAQESGALPAQLLRQRAALTLTHLTPALLLARPKTPLHDRCRLIQGRLLAALGDRAGARRIFEELRTTLAEPARRELLLLQGGAAPAGR